MKVEMEALKKNRMVVLYRVKLSPFWRHPHAMSFKTVSSGAFELFTVLQINVT